jgi:hypothetical protein
MPKSRAYRIQISCLRIVSESPSKGRTHSAKRSTAVNDLCHHLESDGKSPVLK